MVLELEWLRKAGAALLHDADEEEEKDYLHRPLGESQWSFLSL